MSTEDVLSSPGAQIRRLREERALRPVDIQRISDSVKQQKSSGDFGISHATLNDIENGNSVPNVRKMFSLAVCFQVPLEHILSIYGASPDDVGKYYEPPTRQETRIALLDPSFVVQFDTPFDSLRTGPLTGDATHWPTKLPEPLQSRLNPSAYSYAWVGTQDTAMADLIPGGSLIEIDRSRSKVEVAEWSRLRDRPIYFSWTKEGYRCSWCEEDGSDLVILPHPASHTQAKRYRRPREAMLIGQVTYAWVPFGPASPQLRA